MKLLEQATPAIRTYSLYDIQDRIDYFEKKTSIDETFETLLLNTFHQTYLRAESYGSALSRTLMNAKTSSIGKRVRAYSLSHQPTMVITATTTFSEEPTPRTTHETVSADGENTYFYPEETTRLDEIISLTSITSDSEKKTRRSSVQPDLSVCSDTILSASDTEESSQLEPLTVNEQTKFTGVVHATKYTVLDETPIDFSTDDDSSSSSSSSSRSVRSFPLIFERISIPLFCSISYHAKEIKFNVQRTLRLQIRCMLFV